MIGKGAMKIFGFDSILRGERLWIIIVSPELG
jgi:hypothetical protein